MDKDSSSAFQTTRWSLIGRAVADDDGAHQALAEFCRKYRAPLLSFTHRFVTSENDAEDLVQGFFPKLLQKNFLSQADEGRGRLRTFLLTLLKHHITDEYRKENAEKRGGRIRMENIDDQQGVASNSPNPEELFHRQWAMLILDQALSRLRSDWANEGKQDLFDSLKPFLGYSQDNEQERSALAARLCISQGTLNTAIYRLREEYRTALLQEVADTLEIKTKEAALEELRSLLVSV